VKKTNFQRLGRNDLAAKFQQKNFKEIRNVS